MGDKHRARIAPGLIWRQLDENTVIVSPEEGKVRVLNGVGSTIWQLLVEKRSKADIEAHLAAHYDVSPEKASEDLQAFLADLGRRGLIHWEAASRQVNPISEGERG
ncbi:MAG: PqqD family protein [Anaerolineae bacterium]